jgi:hypothetical protein
LLENHAELKDAILMGDPDYMLESLRYWISNRFYFVREGRFGDTVRFNRNSLSSLSLSEVLRAARSLHADSGRPIVIV